MNISHLDLSFNNLRKMPSLPLRKLTAARTLILDGNPLQFLGKNFLLKQGVQSTFLQFSMNVWFKQKMYIQLSFISFYNCIWVHCNYLQTFFACTPCIFQQQSFGTTRALNLNNVFANFRFIAFPEDWLFSAWKYVAAIFFIFWAYLNFFYINWGCCLM